MLFGFLLISTVLGQYCYSGPTSSADTNLGPVTLTGESSSIQDSSNCPKTVGPKDLTGLSANIAPGKAYTLRYNVTSCGDYYESFVGAWIDYNKNGVFEPTESLFPFARYTGPAQATQTFTVPNDLTTRGVTRLRVQLQETNTSTIDPCNLFDFGGTKDFTVNLLPTNLYCNCGPTSEEDTHLGPAIFQGEKRDIIQYANPCPGTLGPQNFTDQLADLVLGKTYPLSISVITCDKAYPNILTSVWIDWNQNSEFEENERVLSPTNRFGAIFIDVNVPSDAKIGPTSLRAMVQEMINGGDTIGPCDLFKYGGTQDYPLQIRATAEEAHPGMQFREQMLSGMNYREDTVINKET